MPDVHRPEDTGSPDRIINVLGLLVGVLALAAAIVFGLFQVFPAFSKDTIPELLRPQPDLSVKVEIERGYNSASFVPEARNNQLGAVFDTDNPEALQYYPLASGINLQINSQRDSGYLRLSPLMLVQLVSYEAQPPATLEVIPFMGGGTGYIHGYNIELSPADVGQVLTGKLYWGPEALEPKPDYFKLEPGDFTVFGLNPTFARSGLYAIRTGIEYYGTGGTPQKVWADKSVLLYVPERIVIAYPMSDARSDCDATMICIDHVLEETPAPPRTMQTEGDLKTHTTPMIEPVPIQARGTDPVYTVTGEKPSIGSDEPSADSFNQAVSLLVDEEISSFALLMAGVEGLPTDSMAILDITYHQTLSGENVASIRFDISGYAGVGAHSFSYTRTLNWDFADNRALTLDQLFGANADYLLTLSLYCRSELQTREYMDSDWINEGTAPVAENYHSWNLTPEGLQINFDEYQVAAYSLGPQIIVIPYSALDSVLAIDGPVSRLRR